jgi:hypothetical protein
MVSESHTLELEKFTEIIRRLKRMERLVQGVAMAPARRIGGNATTNRGTPIRVGTAAQGLDLRPATLCKNPRTLSILWDEYINGVGGRLPAQQFTRIQRGAKFVKSNYCNRKPFWTCMERLIDKGYQQEAALARIGRVYDGCVTKILKAMRKDERNGGHPQCAPTKPRKGSLVRGVKRSLVRGVKQPRIGDFTGFTVPAELGPVPPSNEGRLIAMRMETREANRRLARGRFDTTREEESTESEEESDESNGCAAGDLCGMKGTPLTSFHKCKVCKKTVHSFMCCEKWDEDGNYWCKKCGYPRQMDAEEV